jgi:hypothetical protein
VNQTLTAATTRAHTRLPSFIRATGILNSRVRSISILIQDCGRERWLSLILIRNRSRHIKGLGYLLMSCTEIHRELLSPTGMQRIRTAIITSYHFLVHCTPPSAVSSILRTGLLPSFPGAETGADMECVHQCLGVQSPPILCFTPPDFRIKYASVEFAIASTDLPAQVGIDWSFSGYWKSVDEDRQANPGDSIEEIVLRAFRRFRSIVTYNSVAPSALRVRVLGSSLDPSTWPMFGTLTNHHDLFVSRTSML